MRLQSIEFIRRENGFFRFRDKLILSVKLGDGVGVAVFFTPSPLDQDFAKVLGFQPHLWFPSARELDSIMRALNESDERTFQMLRTGWGGVRPRPLKVGDFL